MIKSWILNLSFIKEALKESERQGGIKAFPLAQKDVLETMRDDLDAQAEELAKKKVNDLFSNADILSIVTLDKRNGVVFIGGERTDDVRLSNLRSEAEFFVQSELWKLLQETPKRLAEKAMFVDDGKIENQLLKGRAILYTLDAQKNIVDVFHSLKK